MVPRVTKTGTPTRSEPPRLSEVARHLVLPTGIVSTGWPAVRAKCRDLGLGFDRWQDGAGRCILAKRDTGLYAAGATQGGRFAVQYPISLKGLSCGMCMVYGKIAGENAAAGK